MASWIAAILLVAVAIPLTRSDSEPVTATEPGPGSVAGDTEAIERCGSRGGYDAGTDLVAAYNTTIGDVTAWLDSPQPADWGHVVHDYEKDRDVTEPAVICFIDGQFMAGLGAQPNRAALVILTTGEVHFLAAGFHDVEGEQEFRTGRPLPCSSDPATDLRKEPAYSAPHLYRWTRDGCPVRKDVIMTRDNCGPRNILMTIPLAAPNTETPYRQFANPVTIADLPDDAASTGYAFEGATLWMVPNNYSALYLESSHIEQWAWNHHPHICE